MFHRYGFFEWRHLLDPGVRDRDRSAQIMITVELAAGAVGQNGRPRSRVFSSVPSG